MRKLAVVVAALLILVAACDAETFDSLRTTLRDQPLPPFSLTDQKGQTVSRDDLLGKVWVVNFFFTGCTGDCIKTMPNMIRLHKEFANWPEVEFVSISVFPTQDTPERLRDYARDRLQDPERWHLLTGEEAKIYQLIEKEFYQAVAKREKASPGLEVFHTPTLMVVDQDGYIRGYTNGTDDAEVTRMAERIKELALPLRPKDLRATLARIFPHINASLNALAGVLLLLGYVAVRRRWLTLHKGLMLSALAASGLFLACYLFYHFAILQGQPTRFTPEGPIRYLYYAILLSHTILAVIVAPLALTITYLGLSNRLANHRWLARWTLPAWLYVSITGVVVYVMLYHLYPPA